MISVICVYNNKKTFEDNLLKSLKVQDVEYELVTVDNTQHQFDSAAKALNWGAKKATCDYLMIVHQDIVLLENTCLKKVETILAKIENLGIAGCVGVTEEGEDVGFIKDRTSIYGKPLSDLAEVQTLDECIFFIPKKVFEKFNFDENNHGWHVYAIDYCLTVKTKGYRAVVVPCFVWHNTSFSNWKDIWKSQKFIWCKHHKNWARIYTTCGFLYSKYFLSRRIIKVIERCLQNKIKISLFPSYLSSFGEHIDSEFSRFKKILIFETIDKAAAQYYSLPIKVTTEALLVYRQNADKARVQYCFSADPKRDLDWIYDSCFDAVLFQLDLFETFQMDEVCHLMDVLQKSAGKIIIYSLQDSFLNKNLVQVLVSCGFVEKRILMRHFFSSSTRNFIFLTREKNN